MHGEDEPDEPERDRPPEAPFPDPSLEDELTELFSEHLRAARASEAAQASKAQRRHSRRYPALRLLPHVRPLPAIVLVLVFVTAAAAAVTFTLRRSAPLSGRVPPVARAARWGIGFTEAGRHYRIVFAPTLTAGEAGWTSFIYLGRHGRQGRIGGSEGYPTTGLPALPTAGDYLTIGHGAGEIVHYALTGPAVAAVQVGAKTIQTRRGAALPSGDRVAAFTLPAGSARARSSRKAPLPARLRLAGPQTIRPLRIVPLDRHGAPIQATGSSEYAPRLPVRTSRRRPGAGAERAGISPPALHSGACALARHGLPALTAVQAEVALRLRPITNALGELLFSCLQVTYTLHGSQLNAAILLDARQPGREQPGPIPGAKPVRGHPGTVNAVLGPTLGDITARRDGKAWLLVAGGGGISQRLEVLAALRIARLAADDPRP